MSTVLAEFNEEYKDYGKEEAKTPFSERLKEAIANETEKAVDVANADDVIDELNEGKKRPNRFKEFAKQPVKATQTLWKSGTEGIQKIKTLHGAGLLLVVILFIVIAIKPTANGKTRLQMMFHSLLGGTLLEGVESETLTYGSSVPEGMSTLEKAETGFNYIGEQFMDGIQGGLTASVGVGLLP